MEEFECYDITICDRCDHYSVSPGGCTEICNAQRIGSKHIIWMDDLYVQERMNGNKKHCKAFKKLTKRYKK